MLSKNHFGISSQLTTTLRKLHTPRHLARDDARLASNGRSYRIHLAGE
jgi:hypothetical protein